MRLVLGLSAAACGFLAAAPGTAEACLPPLQPQVPLTVGATVPPDGLILFDRGDSGWNLDYLIPNGSTPPDSSDVWFMQADVIDVVDSSGVTADGNLETVRFWLAWRPTSPLSEGDYTVNWRHDDREEFQSFTFEVSAGDEGDLPTFDGRSIAGTVPGDFAACDTQGGCGPSRVALSDVGVARVQISATWSSELLRSQVEIIADGAPACVGCDAFDSIVQREHRSSYPITIETRDLRSAQVVHSEQLDIAYAGPAFTATPRDVGNAILASGCAAPGEELEDAWCTSLSSACAADDSDPRCDTLAETCSTVDPDVGDCADCVSVDETGAGCSATHGRGSGTDLAIGLALLGLVWFRRRA